MLLSFFVFSGDGVIKIWDRDKTLLREIMMNETLTVASFLNTRGKVIVTVNKKIDAFLHLLFTKRHLFSPFCFQGIF